MNYYYNHQHSLISENERLKRLIRSYEYQKFSLEKEICKLEAENKLLKELMDKVFPFQVENLYCNSHAFNLDQFKVNSMQSGSALNLGEAIANKTNSDMDMKMGDNSMNNGDENRLDNYEPSPS